MIHNLNLNTKYSKSPYILGKRILSFIFLQKFCLTYTVFICFFLNLFYYLRMLIIFFRDWCFLVRTVFLKNRYNISYIVSYHKEYYIYFNKIFKRYMSIFEKYVAFLNNTKYSFIKFILNFFLHKFSCFILLLTCVKNNPLKKNKKNECISFIWIFK